MHSSSSDLNPLTALLQAYPAGCLLLRDSLAASGHFLLPWFISASINQGHKVVLIAAAYSPASHKAALKKIGTNGIAAAGISHCNGDGSPLAFVSAANAFSSPDRPTADAPQAGGLQLLYQHVQAAASSLVSQVQSSNLDTAQQSQQQSQQQQPQQQPGRQQHPGSQQQQQFLTVVVDSLACLSSLAGNQQQLAAFMHHVTALGEVLQVSCRLVLLAAADAHADSQLLAALAAAAHVTADVAPLEGRPAALDGSLTVCIRRAAPKRQPAEPQHSQQRGGSSSSVLPGWLCPGSCSVWFFRASDVAVWWLSEVQGKDLLM